MDITPPRGISTFVGTPDLGVPQKDLDNVVLIPNPWNDETEAYLSLLATDFIN